MKVPALAGVPVRVGVGVRARVRVRVREGVGVGVGARVRFAIREVLVVCEVCEVYDLMRGPVELFPFN